MPQREHAPHPPGLLSDSESWQHSLTVTDFLEVVCLGQLLQRLAAIQPGVAVVQQPELQLPGSVIICSRQIRSFI